MLVANSVSRLLLAGAVMVPLAACYTTTEDVDRLAVTEMDGRGYDRALTREYRDLASYEAYQMYDWGDARLFARKGLDAADGARPVPERVADWKLAYGVQAPVRCQEAAGGIARQGCRQPFA